MENNTPREDVSSEIVRNDERQKLLASGRPIVITIGPKETSWREKCRKCITLSSLFMAYLLVSAAYSIIAPFYPQEVSI